LKRLMQFLPHFHVSMMFFIYYRILFDGFVLMLGV